MCKKTNKQAKTDAAFSFLRFVDMSPYEASYIFKGNLVERWIDHLAKRDQRARRRFYQHEPTSAANTYGMLLISDIETTTSPFVIAPGSALDELTHVSDKLVHPASLFDQFFLPPVSSHVRSLLLSFSTDILSYYMIGQSCTYRYHL